MTDNRTIKTLSFSLSAFFVFLLSACVATPEKPAEGTSGSMTEAVTEAMPATEAAPAETTPTQPTGTDVTKEETVAEVKTEPASQQPEITPFVREAFGVTTTLAKVEEKPAEPIVIVESCKGEPYEQYEKQSLASLKKGLDALKAEKFGVGFRNTDDYNRWVRIHESLYKSVDKYCNDLKQCAAKHAKNKDKECAVQAFVYNEWKQKAESFAKKAKAIETSEPDPICSVTPNLADDPNCFHALGDNFDRFCADAECKEVSDCWRGVGFLDQAIKQARQACGFVHQELSSCRGYQEATKRRKDKFDRCMSMQEQVGLPFFPDI